MTLPSSGHQAKVMALRCMAERKGVSSRSSLLISTRCLWVTLPLSGHHAKVVVVEINAAARAILWRMEKTLAID
jgi:hypothetical protein